MKRLGIIGFLLLVSVLYTIFVWWFFDENSSAITNGKIKKCGPEYDTVCVIDTQDFRPIVEHSKIRKK